MYYNRLLIFCDNHEVIGIAIAGVDNDEDAPPDSDENGRPDNDYLRGGWCILHGDRHENLDT